MSKELYLKIEENMVRHPALFKFLKLLADITTGLVYVVYPYFLVVLLLQKDGFFLYALLVPGISFVILSLVRKKINAPRPYEVWQVKPLIVKDTVGNSFPSRHVFSIYMVATTIYMVYPYVGLAMFVAGLYLALFRVISGVHFIKDVVVGGLIGLVVGFAAYGLLL